MYDDLSTDVPRLPADDLRRVAGYQRWIIACILAQVALFFGLLLLQIFTRRYRSGTEDLALFVTLLLGACGGLWVFLANMVLRNFLVASMMGAASLVPFLGILAMTAVNSVITRTLNAHGVEVGLFGADLDSIREGMGGYDDDGDAGW